MNKENLLKMADYLETLEPESFDMKSYTKGGDYCARDVEHLCGSVGCVIGHAPRVFGTEEEDYRKMPLLQTPAYLFDWEAFSSRIFELKDLQWDWCFDSDWIYIDNTPKGAALRIRYLVENGLPEDSEWQLHEISDYMFKDQLGDSNE